MTKYLYSKQNYKMYIILKENATLKPKKKKSKCIKIH